MKAHTIVVADDAADLRRILVAALQRDPRLRIVAEAGDGEEALVAVAVHRPDVLLLDLSMPLVDGLGVLARLPADTATQVVMFSGFGNTTLRQQCLDAGAVDYVEKGLPIKQLCDRLADAAEGVR